MVSIAVRWTYLCISLDDSISSMCSLYTFSRIQLKLLFNTISVNLKGLLNSVFCYGVYISDCISSMRMAFAIAKKCCKLTLETPLYILVILLEHSLLQWKKWLHIFEYSFTVGGHLFSRGRHSGSKIKPLWCTKVLTTTSVYLFARVQRMNRRGVVGKRKAWTFSKASQCLCMKGYNYRLGGWLLLGRLFWWTYSPPPSPPRW